MKSVTPSSFCENCQKFQIERLFAVPDAKNAGNTDLVNKNNVSRLVLGGCGLCDFFLECLPERCKVRSANGTWSICMNSASSPDARDPARVTVWPHPLKQEEILGALWVTISPEKGELGDLRLSSFVCIDSGRLPTYALQVSPLRLDLAPVSEWLKTEIHTEQAQSYGGVSSANLALTVIDCSTRRLVPLLDEERYATLSYVWGPHAQPSLDDTNGDRLPLHLPNTIQDSIDVCIRLGICYLWVDRYCIPRESGHLRSLQISRMDEVYQNSFLTIVACAGEDPNLGLPGISRQRLSNPCIEIVGLGCIRGLSQHIEIRHSIWATRAWTYQEALLSQRQLYFTNKEMFFGSAKGMLGRESSLSGSKLEQFLPPHLRAEYFIPGTTRDSSDRNYSIERLNVWECIQEYSSRALSYQSDVLNALLGILAYYRRQHGICHLWGIPFSTSVLVPPPFNYLRFEMSLRWISNSYSSRRKGFPSWSWTGYNGSVSHIDLMWGGKYMAPTEEEAVHIDVELVSGRLLRWSDYQADYANLQDYTQPRSSIENADQPSQFIHLEALTSQITVKSTDSQDAHYRPMRGAIVKDDEIIKLFSSVESPTYETSNVEIQKSFPVGSLLALYFSQPFPLSRRGLDSESRPALLVRNAGDYWERVCLLGSEKFLKREDVHKVRRKIRLG